VSWLAALPASANAADHRDGPIFPALGKTIGNLDLNDLYAFTPTAGRPQALSAAPSNSVFIMTVGPAPGILSPPYFFPGAHYEFCINNTGHTVDGDLILRFVFSHPDHAMRQTFTMTMFNGAGIEVDNGGQSGITSVGTDGASFHVAKLHGGGQMAAGIFGDPFAMDVVAFMRFLHDVRTGVPLTLRFGEFTRSDIHPVNFYAHFNTLAIIVELPRMQVQSSAKNSRISIWVRTVADVGDGRGMVQHDRAANPGVNTMLVTPAQDDPANNPLLPPILNFGPLQNRMNANPPSFDFGVQQAIAARITAAYGATQKTAGTLAKTFLPDVMSFDTTNPAGFNSGLQLTRNGRRLTDDVVDAELNALTGGAVTSDRVSSSTPVRATFPYLGPPQSPAAALQALDVQGANLDRVLDEVLNPRN
jgi:hypothetical protein